MSGLDVEALLESAAKSATSNSRAGSTALSHVEDTHRPDGRDRRSRDRDYDRSSHRRPRSRDERSERDTNGDNSVNDSVLGKRRRSRSRDSDDRSHRTGRHRRHSRSRSPPDDDRYYRPIGRSRRDRDRGGRRGRARSNSSRRSRSPQPTEDERDRRTIFVQQLAVRLRTKELIEFFEKVGPVKEAQIVKDRVSNRSKGVGYVEFKSEESVPLALQLTGQKLLGIPIIAQLTEAEKNRQARTVTDSSQPATQKPSGGPQLFYRLYVGNIHFNITEGDLRTIFEPFGELEFVQLQKEDTGRSKGYGFVQFTDPAAAKEALEKMNGFDLAGRPIRVGLGNEKSNHSNTQRTSQPIGQVQTPTNHSVVNDSNQFDRISGRESDMASGASALDDSDVVGVNFNNFSRDALMRKLARVEQPSDTAGANGTASLNLPTLPIDVPPSSRCVIVKNMFNASEETEEDWVKDLEGDVREECQGKYGDVVSVVVDPSTEGEVYIKFKTVMGGEKAVEGLHGRYFAGREITAQPVVDAVFNVFVRSKPV